MSDLHVWEPPDDWTDEDMEEWIRDAGGREIVLRSFDGEYLNGRRAERGLVWVEQTPST